MNRAEKQSPGPRSPAGSEMNEGKSKNEGAAAERVAEVEPSSGHAQWEGRRLMLSFGVCALVVIAAVVYEKCG